ncbi:MAG: TIM-barrel domain-containing protein [Aeromicrobium sp.]
MRITTDPYRMEVLDPQGRVRLSEVANTKPGPAPYVGLDPAPLGSTVGQTPPLVSPLVLTVGVAPKAYFPALFWSGNLLLGATAGMQYAATRVLSVSRDGKGGLVLDVGTTSPTGDHFRVAVSPAGKRFVVDVSVTGGLGEGVTSQLITHSFKAPAGEAYHGFGGRHESTDLRGSQFHSWVAQQNLGVGPLQGAVGALPGTGGESYMFPNGPSAAYYVQPQFVSQKYAFLADQSDLLRWRMAAPDTPDAWQVTAPAPRLREVVVPSGPTSSIPELTRTTGRHQVPPDWALGPQMDRLIYTNDTPATYQAKVEADLARFRAKTLPVTAYRIEGWDVLAEDDLRRDVARLRKLKIHPLAYFRAFVSADNAGTEKSELYDEALAKGYGARRKSGEPYVTGGTFGGAALVIDFTNPAARKWFAGRITQALDQGADGFMADFGEQVQPDMYFANGETGTTMHNKYTALFQEVVDETVASYQRRHPDRSFFRYNRAGFTGSAGHEVANFPGDETTDWGKASGLASLAPDMLNRGVGGAYGFTTDIGGYADQLSGKTSSELLVRWAEWAVLSPVFRLHGSAGSGTHMPWDYDAATLAAYRKQVVIRQRVAPLIGRLWSSAKRTGMPIATPMWLAYPNDAIAAKQDQQWLLGRDVLAAPVITQGATTRRVYLPEGCWAYQPTGKRYAGRQSVTVPAPVGTLPFFFRCGSKPF